MSVDKLVDSTQLDADLTSVANAIRAKSGGSGQLAFPAGFVSEIGNIPTGGGGSDAPTFTIVWDDNWEYEISVTCDKTYAECLALTEAESPINYCQIIMTDQSQTAQFMETAGFIGLIVDSGMQVDYLQYTMTAGLAPVLDIRYYANGQATIEMPSATEQTLTVASNGTYHPQTNKSLQEVIVNVPSTTVSPLSVTQNGVYTAPQGEAYSPVTVNVSGGGGASNVVTGTFKGTTGNTSLDITLNYSGNGYPIMVVIMPAEGASNANGTFYNTMQRYAVNSYIVTKSYTQTPPNYNKTATADEAVGIYRYKSSATSATTYSVNSTSTTSLYSDEDPTNNAAGCVRIRSATKMSVRIASSQYGFMVDIDYKYAVIYSS